MIEQDLAKQKCVPCEAGVPTLTTKEINEYLPKLKGWEVNDYKDENGTGAIIRKNIVCKDYKQALDIVNAVSIVAESEGHHPDISFGYGYVEFRLTTHAINGLSRNDFILAARIDEKINSIYL